MRFMAIGAVAAAAALTAAGCSSSGGSSGGGGSSSGGKTTITELDYFTTGGTNTAVIKYNKQFEEAHPDVTVKREVVPFANLITKVLQEASAGDLPNIVMLDDPNVPQVAATGQLLPLKGRPGFTTAGYVPGAISECSYQGKQYCFPIGTNTVGLIYNKKMFAAKHLSPPATWAQLESDAKALTSGKVYGFAFDATADEQSTFQLEPWAWGAGGKLDDVNSAAWKNSLQVWVNLVKNHSSSKSVLQWGQSPDLVQQFTNKTAAMMENGPWAFPLLNAAGMKYNVDYGVVPIPSESAGQTPITPLGGETWNLGKSGSSTQQADGLGLDQGHPDSGDDDLLLKRFVLPAHQDCGARPVHQAEPAVPGVRQGDRDFPGAHRRIRRQLPEGLAGHLDRHPVRDHRHLVGELGADPGAIHGVRSPEGQQ